MSYPLDNRYVKKEDIKAFNGITKEEMWYKWQSDKRILTMYMHAMAHYGVTKYDDVKAIAELQIENNKR